MIKLKNPEQLEKMRIAGRITAQALMVAKEHIKPGATPLAVDKAIRHFIEKEGARPSFLGYGGFPASACISINDEVIHGIPNDKPFRDGDLVKVDVGAYIGGFHGDSARTFFCGNVSDEAKRLEEVTRLSFFAGMEKAVVGNRLGDISAAVQEVVEKAGFSVVRDYVGHGIGTELHEDPEVPNFGRAGRGVRLSTGMVIALEPMVNVGDYRVKVLDNDWTVVTVDGSLSAHYENTIVITENGPEILTKI
ncbi:MAG: type I methionyl aminopeptidase [Clostridia bacterium]|nr:type I methionyl aminopeptidase [Clostridia bacterium]